MNQFRVISINVLCVLSLLYIYWSSKSNLSDMSKPSDIPPSQKEEEESNQQLFVAFLGPTKTGTTTIQCLARRLEPELKENNFVFLGIDRNKCGNDKQEKILFGQKLSNLPTLEHEIEQLRKQRKSVIISEEMLAPILSKNNTKTKTIKEFFQNIAKDWNNIRLILNYRRYHNRLPSMYGQCFTGIKTLNTSVVSFPNFYRRHRSNPQYNMSGMIVYWKHEFPNAEIRKFNMHADYDGSNSFPTNFFCKTLPEAISVCNALRRNINNISDLSTNVAAKRITSPLLSSIIDEANNRGWFNKKELFTKDEKLFRNFNKQVQKLFLKLSGNSSIPMDCLSKSEIEEFLETDMLMEQSMFPEFFVSTKGKAELLSGFYHDALNKKFCSIDVPTLMTSRENEWMLALRQLVNDTQAEGID